MNRGEFTPSKFDEELVDGVLCNQELLLGEQATFLRYGEDVELSVGWQGDEPLFGKLIRLLLLLLGGDLLPIWLAHHGDSVG